MKRSGRIGPGASTILMILLVLMMTMLGVLALTSARNDREMSRRTEQSAIDYYNAQTEFGLWISELDNSLLALRERAAGDAQTYARLVLEEHAAAVGMEMEFSVEAGGSRALAARVEILPLTEKDRIRILETRLVPSGGEELEEGEGWTLIA